MTIVTEVESLHERTCVHVTSTPGVQMVSAEIDQRKNNFRKKQRCLLTSENSLSYISVDFSSKWLLIAHLVRDAGCQRGAWWKWLTKTGVDDQVLIVALVVPTLREWPPSRRQRLIK